MDNLKDRMTRFQRAGISYSRIAKSAGISRSTITKWFNGTNTELEERTQENLDRAMREIADELMTIAYEGRYEVKYDDDF